MSLDAIRRIRPLYVVLSKLRWAGGRAFMRLCHGLLGVKPRRVFFSSFNGRGFVDSPARICEALHALRPDAEILWQLKRHADAPDYVHAVRPHSLKALWAISTSRCIVDNFNRPHYMLKFSDQKYVQTWHGDRGFKKVLFDMEDGQHFPDGEQMDLCVSGSDFGTRVYRSAFHYHGEVMQLGIPRNDVLVSPDPAAIKEMRARLSLKDGVKVMLYAPTFRDNRVGETQSAGFDIGKALDRLEAASGERWICLTRAHSMNRAVESTGDARIRDVTNWPETSQLLLCTDLLITDYSSIAGDFILLDRPVILYQADFEQYTDSSRKMYVDFESCPFARALSEKQMYVLLGEIDALVPRCEQVRRFFGATESGNSARAVAEWISAILPRA